MNPSKEELKFLKQIADFEFSNDRLSTLSDIAKARLKEEKEIEKLDTSYIFNEDDEKYLSNMEKNKMIDEEKERYREEIEYQDGRYEMPLDCQDKDNHIKTIEEERRQKTNTQIFLFLLFAVFVGLISS